MQLRSSAVIILVCALQSALVASPGLTKSQIRTELVFTSLLGYILQHDIPNFHGPYFVEFNSLNDDFTSNNAMLTRVQVNFPQFRPMSRTSREPPFFDNVTKERGVQLAVYGFSFTSKSRATVSVRFLSDKLAGAIYDYTLRQNKGKWRVINKKTDGII